MKKLFYLTVCVFLAGNLWAQQTTIHDSNVELRDVKDFHAIEVSNGIDLYLSHGEQERVAVTARDIKWRDRIRTEVVDGVLKIFIKKEDGFRWRSSPKMKVYISFLKLDRLNASGASDVFVDGEIAGGDLLIGLSGASDFKGSVRVDQLVLDQSGASDAVIRGTVVGLTTIHTSGASDIKGYELSTDSCVAHASGASDIQITVHKEIDTQASGASSVHYKGDPPVEKIHSSGASSVKKV
jgi:Putative auto-transporter adhesin, head GIN domain